MEHVCECACVRKCVSREGRPVERANFPPTEWDRRVSVFWGEQVCPCMCVDKKSCVSSQEIKAGHSIHPNVLISPSDKRKIWGSILVPTTYRENCRNKLLFSFWTLFQIHFPHSNVPICAVIACYLKCNEALMLIPPCSLEAGLFRHRQSNSCLFFLFCNHFSLTIFTFDSNWTYFFSPCLEFLTCFTPNISSLHHLELIRRVNAWGLMDPCSDVGTFFHKFFVIRQSCIWA